MRDRAAEGRQANVEVETNVQGPGSWKVGGDRSVSEVKEMGFLGLPGHQELSRVFKKSFDTHEP